MNAPTPPPATRNLLPSGSALLRPSASANGAAANPTGPEVGKLAADAGEALVANLPRVIEAASARAADLGRSVGTATESLRAQIEKSASEPGARKKLVRAAVAGAAALAVAAGAGWIYAASRASELAKSAIDGFLLDTRLAGQVTYGGVSASPFGRVTIERVAIAGGPDFPAVAIRSIRLSDLRESISGSVRFDGIEFSVADVARRGGSGPWRDLLGAGIDRLETNLTLDTTYAAAAGELGIALEAESGAVGSVSAKVQIAGIPRNSGESIVAAARRLRPAGMEGLVESFQALRELQSIAARAGVGSIAVEIDNRPWIRLEAKFPSDPLPPGAAPADAATRSQSIAARMFDAGLPADMAGPNGEAIVKWGVSGGKLKIRMAEGKVVPFAALFSDGADALARAGVRITLD
jgi:hypothetical protein